MVLIKDKQSHIWSATDRDWVPSSLASDSGGGAVKSLSPLLAPGYLRGWEAFNIVGLVNNDPIASVIDVSPANDPAVQATGANKPLYTTSAIDTHPSMKFDGSNDFLSFTAVTTIRTVYLILKHRTGAQDYAPVLGHPTLFDFAGGPGNALFDSSSANANVRNGAAYINGIPENPLNITKPTSFRLISLVTTGNVSAQYITNDRNTAGRYWDGEIVAVHLFSVAHSDGTRAGIEQFFKDRYPSLTRTASVLAPLLVYDGNSQTANPSYQVRVGNCLAGNCASLTPIPSGYAERNFAVSGQTTPQMSADAATQIDPLYSLSRTKNVLVAWECTNDLYNGASATTAYNNFVAYCLARRDAGFQVVAVTVLPRSNAGTPAGFETARGTVNTNIRNNWTTFADAIADIAADHTIGDAGDETNTTYYSDLVHLTDAGYDIVAPIVATAITGLPAGLAGATTPSSFFDLIVPPLSSIIMPLRAFQNRVDALLSSLFGLLTAGQLPATATNDNASTGKLGEYVVATARRNAPVTLTNTVTANIVSIALSAGDWDISAVASLLSGITTATFWDLGLNTTSATMPAVNSTFGDSAIENLFANTSGADLSAVIPTVRFSLSASTTIYLVVNVGFTGGTGKAYGRISARRVR